MNDLKITIIGAGKIGTSIANGLYESGEFNINNIILSDINIDKLTSFNDKGFELCDDNIKAVEKSEFILLCVEPHHAEGVLNQIGSSLISGKHTFASVVTGLKLSQIKEKISDNVDVIRVMPNTAVAVRESMTCISYDKVSDSSRNKVLSVFNTVGETVEIKEEMMSSATALCACGIAFFMRAIRAAAQGGIEVGFHAENAIHMAAQTARGASQLLLSMGNHPEFEIDKVTTPMGCTIAGLNQLEHEGFSSAMIKGITTSTKVASGLYKKQF